MKKIIFSIIATIFTFSSTSYADFQMIPESRHQQYMTYGLFTEEHSAFLWRNAGRAWGALGGGISLVEATDWGWKPQLTLIGSANSAFRFRSDSLELLTDTTDARVGLLVEVEFTEDWRLSFGLFHFSGHISDNVPDAFLIGPNVGNDGFRVRVVHDIDKKFRMGSTFRPFVTSEPAVKFFAADQFVEWFPCLISDNPRHFTPYLAAGLEEYGTTKIELSGHIQTGVLVGNHFLPKHIPSFRLAAGFYSGVDPRLKYAQYLYARSQFFYSGIFFDL